MTNMVKENKMNKNTLKVNRTITDEQFHNMTIDDMITSIYFCQEVLMGSREDTELISTQLIKIFYSIIRQGNLDLDDIVMKETVTSPWDTELSERMKKKWKKESSINPSYGRKDMMFIWITEELKYEYETRIGVK